MSGSRDQRERQHCALLVEYDGARFQGWSRQPDAISIEGAVLAALAALKLEDPVVRCAGRTDAGVHAIGQVLSLSYEGPIPVERIRPALNGDLPNDICIMDAHACSPEFDARACALSRSYEYRVLSSSVHSPLRRNRVFHQPRQLDTAMLDRAAAAVVGQHDFTAFTPSQTKHRYFHRTVLDSRWERVDDELHYRIRGKNFLRHMVRVLVGTMLAVGRGDMELEHFLYLLEGATRDEAHNTAPAHALTLTGVEYDDAWGLPASWVR